MSRLPVIKTRKIIAALQRAGFRRDHQTGSHLSLYHPATRRQTVVPIHSKELNRGILKAILKQAGLTEDEFRELL
ncbi:MAG: type II toxin-antitoxin system HicA family toxin [Limisphaerales bacterium]